MMSFAAGTLAAVAAYIANRIIIARIGNKGMVTFIPIVEESLKSLAALVLGASLINTHSVFGAIEAGYEIVGAKSISGVLGGLSSFAAHGVLGLVTFWVFRISGNLLLGIGAAAVLHSLWNSLITRTYTRN